MSDHAQTAIEASAAITSASSKTAVAGGGVTFLGWVAGLDPMTVIGVCVGLGGFIVSLLSFFINWYYKQKEDKRAQEIHELEKQKLMGKCDVE